MTLELSVQNGTETRQCRVSGFRHPAYLYLKSNGKQEFLAKILQPRAARGDQSTR